MAYFKKKENMFLWKFVELLKKDWFTDKHYKKITNL